MAVRGAIPRLGHGVVRAHRTSNHSELGYELYIPTEIAAALFDEIVEEAEPEGPRCCGDFALESLRIEKGFRVWGHAIGPRDTPLEAGLAFALKLDTNLDFTGKDALLRQRERGISRRLVGFVFQEADAYPLDSHPIDRNGCICGYTTSNAYGHTLGRPVSLGWVERGSMMPDDVLSDSYEIEVGVRRYRVSPSLQAPYDPAGQRLRS